MSSKKNNPTSSKVLPKYIKITDLTKLRQYSDMIDDVEMFFTVFGSPVPINSTDTLYRETGIKDSFLFYWPRHLSCEKGKASGEHAYIGTMAVAKVENRNNINYMRKELVEQLALPY
jgi:hypothetical protein